MVTCLTVTNHTCQECGLRKLCFPFGLEQSDVLRLDALVHRKPVIKKGDKLFSSGQLFQSVYAIKAGGFKLYAPQLNGEEKLIGFYLPGDILGVDALSSGVHDSTAVAFENASVCEIPFKELEQLSLQIPTLNRQLLSVMGKELSDERMRGELLSRKSAEGRLSLFILWLSQRQRRRGYNDELFQLNLLHKDIAEYLGLTPETISRVLARFNDENIVEWRQKQVRIKNSVKLNEMVHY